MTPDFLLIEQCRRHVRRMNHQHHWNLDDALEEQYTQAVATCFPASDMPPDKKIVHTIWFYHADHKLVDAFNEPGAIDHAYWTKWTHDVIRIIMSNPIRVFIMLDSSIQLEDLVQEAQVEVLLHIRSYRYQSQFRTWAYQVITNRILRYNRVLRSNRGKLHVRANSLDALLDDQEQTPQLRSIGASGPTVEELVCSSTIMALVQHVLLSKGDKRLSDIFKLWAQEDYTLRMIGERFNLSQPRVHALVQRAQTILQNEPAIRDWAADRRSNAA